MTLRRNGARSLIDLKSEQSLKSVIRTELKDLIDQSIQDCLQNKKIPVATIDINVDKECIRCGSEVRKSSDKTVRLNVSTSSIDVLSESDRKGQVHKVKSEEDDNAHWMAWRTHDEKPNITKSCNFTTDICQPPSSDRKYQCKSLVMRPKTATGGENPNIEYSASESVEKAAQPNLNSKDDDNTHWMVWRTYDDKPYNTKSHKFKNSQCQPLRSDLSHRCASPFMRPKTATCHRNQSDGYREKYKEYSPYSIKTTEEPRLMNNGYSVGLSKPMASVAVGPDKHYEELGTNTQRSYQISDYLKKSMNLNDPYERSLYSNLMEVMRKKPQQHCGVEGEGSEIDPIIEISEYKHRFQNPRMKIAFPTSRTQTLVTVKKPPKCPHQSRSNGVVRPQTSSTSGFRSGEQYLY